jgi:hypothetical protein
MVSQMRLAIFHRQQKLPWYNKLMMGFGYGGMADWGTFGVITWIVVFVDLILLGVWLWKQINK